jgi:glycosyltransferase involved in cell wall biosynthesis
MNSISFSILIPAYKTAFLRECIDSVLAQSYRTFELVIVDDASPEDIKSIIDNYDDSRIRYYRNETNFGAVDVVDNWNKCLSYAKGDYVICMGDDDRLSPNCLEEYTKLINRYPSIKVFHGRTELIDENGKCLNVLECREEIESTLTHIYYRWRGRYQYIGDFCYETKTLIRLGGFYKLPLAWASDDISAVRQSAIDGYIVNSNMVLFQYRINRSTITSSGANMVKLEAINEEKKWFDVFLNNYQYNIDEKKIFSLLIEMKDRHFQKKSLDIISTDVCLKPWTFFSYIPKMKQYGLTAKMLAYIVLQALMMIGKRL